MELVFGHTRAKAKAISLAKSRKNGIGTQLPAIFRAKSLSLGVAGNWIILETNGATSLSLLLFAWCVLAITSEKHLFYTQE